MPKIISLGLGAYVDAEQIVAVDDAAAVDSDRYKIGYCLHAKSTILLKNGETIPGYVKPDTIRKRWKEAFELKLPESMQEFAAAYIGRMEAGMKKLQEQWESESEVPKAIITMPTGTTVEDLKKCTLFL